MIFFNLIMLFAHAVLFCGRIPLPEIWKLSHEWRRESRSCPWVSSLREGLSILAVLAVRRQLGDGYIGILAIGKALLLPSIDCIGSFWQFAFVALIPVCYFVLQSYLLMLAVVALLLIALLGCASNARAKYLLKASIILAGFRGTSRSFICDEGLLGLNSACECSACWGTTLGSVDIATLPFLDGVFSVSAGGGGPEDVELSTVWDYAPIMFCLASRRPSPSCS